MISWLIVIGLAVDVQRQLVAFRNPRRRLIPPVGQVTKMVEDP